MFPQPVRPSMHAARLFLLSCFALLLGTATLIAAGKSAEADAVPVVAAENFYGDLVQQLGGSQVAVTSILSNPDQDPHLFEASPSTARALSGAKLVVLNGADYDPWMEKLLTATPAVERQIIVVADLMGVKSGDNPHLWYKPDTMPTAAKAITAALVKLDGAHAADYQSRLANFLGSLQPLSAKISAMKTAYSGRPVTATEPVFGYMAEALGLEMRN